MNSNSLLKRTGFGFAAVIGIFGVAQLVRPAHAALNTDPSHTIQATLDPSSTLGPILDRACGECHSNAMTSRWYTQVAPFSYIMALAAKDGRKAVNFAEWTSYAPEQRREFLAASCADATKGTMPVPAYLRFRPDAKLSADDINIICSASR
jgi:hypothetical protein